MPKPSLPSYADIPQVEGMPHGAAWSLFNELYGPNDELGTLNFLTPDVVKAAAQEVQTGERCQLDMALNRIPFPVAGRKPFEHKIIDLEPLGVISTDDEIHINTQSSSQWDGLRHMGHQKSKQYYQGVKHSEILSGTIGTKLGIQNWVKAGGICGRGVLLDWLSWYEAQGKTANPVTAHAIPVSELIEVAKHQGTELRFGDILLVRTGFVRWIEAQTDDQQIKDNIANKYEYIGVRADQDAFKWFWEQHFAAVACDTMSFENWPPVGDLTLHEHFLVFWGCPQGELWNLEKLAKLTKKNNKWSFLLTSAPLHVPGGVATPPNVIAIL